MLVDGHKLETSEGFFLGCLYHPILETQQKKVAIHTAKPYKQCIPVKNSHFLYPLVLKITVV